MSKCIRWFAPRLPALALAAAASYYHLLAR